MTSNGVKLEGEDIFSYTRSRKKGCCKVQTSLQEPFKSVALKIALVAKLCQTLCHSMDCNPSGSSVYGILQARILEWVAFPFSRESSQPRSWTWVFCISGKFFTICWTLRLVGNAVEKFLKKMKSVTSVDTWMIRSEPYCWIEESFRDLDRRSNQLQHSLNPKPNLEQGSNSLQFYGGWVVRKL